MAEVKKDMGFGVDKYDTREDIERFKGLHRKICLYRMHFYSSSPKISQNVLV